MAEKKIKLVIAYDGRRYHGWQRQKNASPTVEQTVQEGIAALLARCCRTVAPEAIALRAAGRTDAGVHARGQTVQLMLDSPVPVERLSRVLNKYLPDDIRVMHAQEVAPAFDASTSALCKLYRYTVHTRADWYPGELNFAAYYPIAYDDDLMRRAANHLVGEHDFKSFAGKLEERKTTVRTLFNCDITRDERESHLLYFDLIGNGFLYHMVRNIVGTLLAVGQGRIDPDAMPAILAACDRSAAGPMAVADGLCMMWVKYPGELLIPVAEAPPSTP